MEWKEPGRYIPIMFLPYSWGSLFGVPSKVPVFYSSNDFAPGFAEDFLEGQAVVRRATLFPTQFSGRGFLSRDWDLTRDYIRDSIRDYTKLQEGPLCPLP